MKILRQLVMVVRLRLAIAQSRSLRRQRAQIDRKTAALHVLLTRALTLTHGGLGHALSTKICPKCGDADMVPLHSTNTKICPSCATEIPWTLTGDQKPTHQPHRAQRKANQE
jgi:hypothetical protein